MQSLMLLLGAVVVACNGLPQFMRWSELQPSQVHEDMSLKFEPAQPFEQLWSSFRAEHGKIYASMAEEAERKLIFSENLKVIRMHNYLYSKGLKTFTLGVNKFADMRLEEFVKTMTGWQNPVQNTTGGSTYLPPISAIDLPDSVDWRTKGYVTPIKNQQQCGSCWAFSTTGAVEGQHFRKTGQLVSLSEQNLIDCCNKEGDHGCEGGFMDYGFQCIKDLGGIDTEASYPYEAKDDTCRFSKTNVGATVTGFVDVTHEDESALKEAVATIGPIAIAIDANHQSFQLYKSGVYVEPKCTKQLDHGVLAIGYGSLNGQDMWIVKNSWGTGWGDHGFIYMARNLKNQCGIASMPSYPLV